MNVAHWYAARTQPRHEKKILEHLGARQVEVFLPVCLSPRRWNNGVRVNLELPLFPGYIFVHTALRDRVLILGVPGVVGLVGRGGRPVPVPDQEIEVLANRIAQLRPEPHPYLTVGDRVRIRSGPLAGHEGILVQKKGHFRFVLAMDLLRQAISVEVDAADLEHLPIAARA